MARPFWSSLASTVRTRRQRRRDPARGRRTIQRLRLERLEERALLAVVSHWTADNTAADAVGTNHGMLISGATYAAGQINQAFRFDGVNDRVGVADSESLKLTASLSIEGWIRVDSFTGGVILFRGDDRGGLDPYNLSFDGNGQLQFAVTDSSNAGTVLKTSVGLGQFMHVAGTLDDSTGAMRLYVNGVLMAQTTTTVRPFGDLDPASNPGIGIGNHGGYPATPHNFPFHGQIDELTVHDQALTAEEVLAHFNAGKGSLQPAITISDAATVEGIAQYRYTGDFVPPDGDGLAAGRYLAVGSDERVYVVSQDTDSVKVYEGGTGAYLGELAAAAGEIDTPWALTFGPDGGLYVAGKATHNVLRFDVSDLTGPSTYDVFVAAGSGGLNVSKGLTFGPDGHLYISSATPPAGGAGPHEVLRFEGPGGGSPGAPLPAPGKSGAVFVSNGAGNLNNPNGLAFGPDGALYVSSTFRDEIVRYNGTTGAFIGSFVAVGSGGLDIPTQIEFRNDGLLYVNSQGTQQVLRYDGGNGNFKDVLVEAPAVAGFAFTASGDLLVSAGLPTQVPGSSVRRYSLSESAEFTVSLSAPWPTTVSVDYQTANGSAIAGSDFVATAGTLTFTPGVRSKTILVTTIDDGAIELNETFNVNLSAPVGGAVADGTGVGTIVDNDTKFYVVDDATINRTYEYGGGTGATGENYSLNGGNSAPRGVASTAAGDRTWVVDANRKVYVYNASGGLLGSWTAGSLASNATVEGIATNGTDIWIVDAKSDKVFKYTDAAGRLSGSQNAASSFNLNSGNTSPKDVVTDGASLWVLNDSTTEKVFKYAVTGSLAGSWTISSGGGSPTGITLDPSAPAHLWIVDSGTDRVYEYANAVGRTSGSQSASASFALAAGNTNPQGIADPPVSAAAVTTAAKTVGSVPAVHVAAKAIPTARHLDTSPTRERGTSVTANPSAEALPTASTVSPDQNPTPRGTAGRAAASLNDYEHGSKRSRDARDAAFDDWTYGELVALAIDDLLADVVS